MVVKLSALRTRGTLLPRNIIIFMFLVLISFRSWVNPSALCGRNRTEINNSRNILEHKIRNFRRNLLRSAIWFHTVPFCATEAHISGLCSSEWNLLPQLLAVLLYSSCYELIPGMAGRETALEHIRLWRCVCIARRQSRDLGAGNCAVGTVSETQNAVLVTKLDSNQIFIINIVIVVGHAVA
jgi:hypothetical protein